MEITCSFASFMQYALPFAGGGFLAAVVCIMVLSHSDEALDKLLTGGFFARLRQASQPASSELGQPASELGQPVQDPNWRE